MGWRIVVRRRVVVNLLTGDAIEGVLMRADRQLLVLADCVIHPREGDSARMDGEAVVERRQVAFVQALPGGG